MFEEGLSSSSMFEEGLSSSSMFEEGLSSSNMLDSSTRNLIVVDDLMAETYELVTTLFTKKISSQEHVQAVSCTETVP